MFPIFTGAGRSGTTLYRSIFDSHPDLFVAHEAHFLGPMAARAGRYEMNGAFDRQRFVDDLYDDHKFVVLGVDRREVAEAFDVAGPADFATAARTVFGVLAQRAGKPRYGDKSPNYASRITEIASVLPETKFVHIVRDGRNVALSLLDRGIGPGTLIDAASHWSSVVRKVGNASRELGPDRILQSRYEDLIAEPESEVRRICDFLHLPFDPRMLAYRERVDEILEPLKAVEWDWAHENLSAPLDPTLRDWRSTMESDDVAAFESVAAEELERHGYTIASDPADRPAVRAAAKGRWLGKRVAFRIRQPLRKRRHRRRLEP